MWELYIPLIFLCLKKKAHGDMHGKGTILIVLEKATEKKSANILNDMVHRIPPHPQKKAVL